MVQKRFPPHLNIKQLVKFFYAFATVNLWNNLIPIPVPKIKDIHIHSVNGGSFDLENTPILFRTRKDERGPINSSIFPERFVPNAFQIEKSRCDLSKR